MGDLKRRKGRQTYGTRLTPPRCGRGGVGGREPWGRKLRSEARGYAPRRDTRASFAGQLGMPIRGRSELSEGLSGARNSSHVATRWASRRRETSAHSKREEPPTRPVTKPSLLSKDLTRGIGGGAGEVGPRNIWSKPVHFCSRCHRTTTGVETGARAGDKHCGLQRRSWAAQGRIFYKYQLQKLAPRVL